MALGVLKRNSRLREVVYENQRETEEVENEKCEQIPWPEIEPKVEPKEVSVSARPRMKLMRKGARRLFSLFILLLLALIVEHVAKKYVESQLLYKWNALETPIPFAPTMLEVVVDRAHLIVQRINIPIRNHYMF